MFYFLFPFISCDANPPVLINLILANFIELPTKMFQLYIGKMSFDLPMEESKESWLFGNGLNTDAQNT